MTSITSLTDKAKSDTQTAIVTFIRNECKERLRGLGNESVSTAQIVAIKTAIADLQAIAARIEQGEYQK